MIIDFHTHLDKDPKSPENLLRSMDKAGIDKSVVFACNVDTLEFSNQDLLNVIEKHSDRFYGAITHNMNFRITNIDMELKLYEELLKHESIVGMKFYPGYEYFYPSDFCARLFLEKLNDIGKLAIFHSGDCFNGAKKAKLKYAHPLHIDEIAVDYPELKIVIAHMAFPWHRDCAQVVQKNDNVHTDISGFVYGEFSHYSIEDFARVMGEYNSIAGINGKKIFGSDYPISDQHSYLRTLEMLYPNTWRQFTRNTVKLIDSVLKK